MHMPNSNEKNQGSTHFMTIAYRHKSVRVANSLCLAALPQLLPQPADSQVTARVLVCRASLHDSQRDAACPYLPAAVRASADVHSWHGPHVCALQLPVCQSATSRAAVPQGLTSCACSLCILCARTCLPAPVLEAYAEELNISLSREPSNLTLFECASEQCQSAKNYAG